MAGPDIASIVDAAINGTDTPSATPTTPGTTAATPPTSSGMGSLFPTHSTLVWIPDKSGQLVAWLIDSSTGQGTPAKDAQGNPLTKPPGSTASPKEVKGSSGEIYSVNPDGSLTQQRGPDTTPTPKNTVPGTGTPPSYTPGQSTDPSDPLAHVGATSPGTPDLPVDVYGAQTARQNAENTAKNDAAARSISQQNADTSAANSAEAAKQNAIGNARAAAQDAWQRTQADIANGLAANRYSLDQAQFLANEAHQKISEDLQRSEQAIQMRGQDLNYLGNQSYVTKGQYESLQGAEGQLAQTGGVGFTPSPTPPGLGYDPAQLAASLAQQALGQTQQVQQPFSLGQAPAAPAGPGFIPPSFEQGGIQTNNPGTPPLAVAARR